MAEHTPGPWTAEHAYSAICKEGQTLARVYWGERRTPAENTANARLIAAAPDLLAALKMCVPASCQAVHHASPNYRDGAPCGKCGYCLAVAAIAKAEGTHDR